MAERKPAAKSSKDKSRTDIRLHGDAVQAVVDGKHNDPFAVMGMHEANGAFTVRAFVPDADTLEVLSLTGESGGVLERRHAAGFFEGAVSFKKRQPLKYRARNGAGEWDVKDPYSFGPVLGPMDDYYIAEGSHLRLFDKFGAHIIDHEGARGVHFAVWAPNASRVSVVGDFNFWDGRRHVMRLRRDTGVWEIFAPDVPAGAAYKYEITASNGDMLPLKADPFAFKSEMRPQTASVVEHSWTQVWGDADHRAFWPRPIRVVPRSQYMKFMQVPGSGGRMAIFCHGTNSPRS